jgi:hypothetical protein
METVQRQEKIKRQLEEVQRWRQSGKSIAVWAQAHGVDARLLMGWVTYEKRWRQRLGQIQSQPHLTTAAVNAAVGATAKAAAKATEPAKPKQLTKGFVAVRSVPVGPVQAVSRAVADAAANPAPPCAMAPISPNPASVRIECAVAGGVAGSGAVSLVLHWPLAQSQELAVLLKSMAAA